jgi:DNA-binding MarR family transcriptional regulator
LASTSESQDILSAILRSELQVLRLVRASAAKEDLTMQQFGTLRLLALRGTITMNVLSEELRVSPPVVTGIIDRLERKALVKRKENSSDRRKTEIVLTNKGEKVYEWIRTDYRLLLQRSLKGSLTKMEQQTLAGLLSKFTSKISPG